MTGKGKVDFRVGAADVAEAVKGLTEPQRRHLREMVNDRGETRFWRPENGGQARCASALRCMGLLGGSFVTSNDAYYLTPEGLAVAEALVLGFA